MITTRPLEADDLEAAARLRSRPEIAVYLGENRFCRVFEIREQLQGKTVLGAFEGDVLMACAVLQVSARARCKHVGQVDLFCGDEGMDAAAALCRHLVDAASNWLQLFKLELSADVGAPWIPAAVMAGFEVELRQTDRRWRGGQRRPDMLLGWVRPGLPWATATSAPVPPQRGERSVIHLRTPMPADAERMALLHREDSVMRGTFQTPLRNADTWRSMLGGTFTAMGVAAEIDGALVGSGVLIPCPRPAVHTFSVGLAVTTERQGCGVGTAIMAALVQVGRDDLAAHRLELEVDVENEAGHALYEKFGFVDEGIRRMGSWRGDGYSNAHCMGLVFQEGT